MKKRCKHCGGDHIDLREHEENCVMKPEPPKRMTDVQLLRWIINNLLTDSQLDVVPPGSKKALRFLAPEERAMDTDYLSYSERKSAEEVMKQYDLDERQQTAAWKALVARSRATPFKAYDAMHAICAEIERS